MSAPAWLIPELEAVIRHGSPERRARALSRTGTLFLAEAGDFNDDHIRLFDHVLSRLLVDADIKARSELAHRLAPLDNAPAGVIRLLARDDAVAVASPVLKQSRRLAEDDLVDIARSKGQAHLLAISCRSRIAEPVTEILVRRGGREVLRSVAGNRGARLTDDSFGALVERAGNDAVLAEKVGSRPDMPPRLFSDLLCKVTGAGTEHLPVQRTIETSPQPDKHDEAAVVGFAENGQYEETVVALARVCALPIQVVDRLMRSARSDPILILCKSVSWGWPTAKAVLMARPGGARSLSAGLDAVFAEFDRISPSAARRIRRFWQFRTTGNGAGTPE